MGEERGTGKNMRACAIEEVFVPVRAVECAAYEFADRS